MPQRRCHQLAKQDYIKRRDWFLAFGRLSLLAIVLVLTFAIPAFAESKVKPLAEGVTLIQDINTDPAAPLIVNTLKIDLKKPGTAISSALAQDGVIESDPTKGRERVSAMTARKDALAGVNADFFPYTGDPLGLVIHQGELVSEPMDRAALGITSDGKVIFGRLNFNATLQPASGDCWPVRGLNRPRGQNEMVIFTPVYGPSSGAKDGMEIVVELDGPIRAGKDVICIVVSDPSPACGTVIPENGAIISAHGRGAEWLAQNLHCGDKLTLRFDLKSDPEADWSSAAEAIGGGPWLVRNGEVYIDAAEEGFKPDFILVRHPRTAVGITASGELLLVTVDGRQTISRGATLAEMAELMKKMGAVNAINLDGGGSTSLSIRGIVSNSPSEGKERLIANALLVYAEPAAADCAAIKFVESGPMEAASGEGRMLSLVNETNGQPISDDLRKSIIWGTTGGIGFVNQEGWFVPIKVGTGTVVALAGDQRIELPVMVVPGKPVKLTARIVPDDFGIPNIGTVAVTLADANGNGIEGKAVAISVEGGTADADRRTTDSNGRVTFNMTWLETSSKAKVKVTSSGLTTIAK